MVQPYNKQSIKEREKYMFQLIPYLKNYKKESIIGPLFKLLEACFELLVPLVMAAIIDEGIKDHDVPYIMKMGGLLVIFGFLGMACSLTAQYFAAKAAAGFGRGLRYDMFRHIQSLSYAEIDKVGTATLITRMTSDINQAQSGVNLVLRLFLRSPFIVVGAMVMSFTINVKLSLIFVVAVPLLSMAIYGIMLVSIPLYKKVQKGLDGVLRSASENLAGVRVIRAFCTQREEEREFKEKSEFLLRIQMLVGRVSALMNPLTYLIVNAAIIAIVWFGGGQVDAGYVTQGEVIALVNYMTQILLALVALANLIVSFTKAMASGSRIMEVFALKPGIMDMDGETMTKEYREGSGRADFAVEMKGVEFAYGNTKEPVLEDICFQVKEGQTIGIIGGTGAGKSTLIQLIGRFYDVTQGSVKVFGKDVRDYKLSELRGLIGLVPQKAVLFHGTIRDNLKFAKEDATDEEIFEALRIAQAEEVVAAKPEGLDTMVSEGGKNLSGGQRQRMTIARALVRRPKILILDDSSSALDFATDARLRGALRESVKDATVFLISQRASTLMHADQILVLDDGKIAGMGTHEELLQTCEVYQEICSSQMSEREVAKHA